MSQRSESSFLCRTVGDEEDKFYRTDTSSSNCRLNLVPTDMKVNFPR
ncbi:MAG: hypothetical protein ACK56I_03950 [bacterium]